MSQDFLKCRNLIEQCNECNESTFSCLLCNAPIHDVKLIVNHYVFNNIPIEYHYQCLYILVRDIYIDQNLDNTIKLLYNRLDKDYSTLLFIHYLLKEKIKTELKYDFID